MTFCLVLRLPDVANQYAIVILDFSPRQRTCFLLENMMTRHLSSPDKIWHGDNRTKVCN